MAKLLAIGYREQKGFRVSYHQICSNCSFQPKAFEMGKQGNVQILMQRCVERELRKNWNSGEVEYSKQLVYFTVPNTECHASGFTGLRPWAPLCPTFPNLPGGRALLKTLRSTWNWRVGRAIYKYERLCENEGKRIEGSVLRWGFGDILFCREKITSKNGCILQCCNFIKNAL
jgi:hypothetical protein